MNVEPGTSWGWWVGLVTALLLYALAARVKVAFRVLSPVDLEALVDRLGEERTEFLRKSLRGPTAFWFSLNIATAAALLLCVVIFFAGSVRLSLLGRTTLLAPTGGLLHDAALLLLLVVALVGVEFLVPVALARLDPASFIARSLPALALLHRVLAPLSRLLASPWGEQESAEETDEARAEEVSAFIDVGTREGILEGDEGELVRNVVEFGDTRVREIMTARTDIVGVESTARVQDVVELMARSRFSRIPVHEGHLDDILGVVTLKDAVAALQEGRADAPVTSLMRRPFIVPESKKVTELLRDFQRGRQQMAIVVDEFGGTAGLVTLEDLLEEIVGEIREEHEVGDDLVKAKDGAWLVRGRASLHDLSEALGVELEPGDSATVGGFLLSTWERVPQPGEVLEHAGFRFEVEQADRRRVVLVRVTPAPPGAGAPRGEGDRVAG